MKCKKCGYEYNGVFCPECGTKNELQKPVKAEIKNKSHKKIGWKGILSALFGMTAIIFKGKIIILEILGLFLGLIGKSKNGKRARIGIVGILLNILAFVMFCYFPASDGASPLEKMVATLREIADVQQGVSMAKDEGKEFEGVAGSEGDLHTEISSSENGEASILNEVSLGGGANPSNGLYDDILNSYEVQIVIFNDEEYFEKYYYDTDVYLDGEVAQATFGNSIYINTALKEGEHELWLTKTVNNKERESNKIKFSISPAYTNQLTIEASLESKKKYSLSIYKENNEIFEGYETEYWDGQEIIRTSNGKQIYYTVKFLVNDTEFIGNNSFISESLIDTVKVAKGQSAVPPSAPEVENYEFVGWSEDLSDIQSNLDVYAIYELREEDWDSQYLGKYQSVPLYGETRDYTCELEINRITNIGIYFSLIFIDKDFGETVIDNEFAEWFVEGATAVFSYDGSSENIGQYRIKISPFVDEGILGVVITDDYGNTNADGRYEKVF